MRPERQSTVYLETVLRIRQKQLRYSSWKLDSPFTTEEIILELLRRRAEKALTPKGNDT